MAEIKVTTYDSSELSTVSITFAENACAAVDELLDVGMTDQPHLMMSIQDFAIDAAYAEGWSECP
jgi:hypothetical protein